MHARKTILLALLFAVGLGGVVQAGPPANARPVIVSPINAADPVGPPPMAEPPPPLAAAPCAADSGRGGFYLQTDFLVGWIDTKSIPALVTTGPSTAPRNVAGVEGAAGTRVLFGDNGINSDGRCGFRLRAGFITDPKCREGYEWGFLVIGREGDLFSRQSDGSQVLARPFFNAVTNLNEASLVAFPNEVAGRIRVRTANDLVGTEINYRCALACLSCNGCPDAVIGPRCEWDFLLGYRALRYRDKITIRENTRPLNVAADVPVNHEVVDSYYTRSMFNGVQVGVEGRYWYHGLTLDARVMAALGQRDARVDVNGYTDRGPIGGPVERLLGGFYAAQSAVGTFKDQDTGFVGELTLRAGYEVSNNLKLTIGYTVLCFCNVIRAGDLIDRTVNLGGLPPNAPADPFRPATILSDNQLWAQGLTLGVEVRY